MIYRIQAHGGKFKDLKNGFQLETDNAKDALRKREETARLCGPDGIVAVRDENGDEISITTLMERAAAE